MPHPSHLSNGDNDSGSSIFKDVGINMTKHKLTQGVVTFWKQQAVVAPCRETAMGQQAGSAYRGTWASAWDPGLEHCTFPPSASSRIGFPDTER